MAATVRSIAALLAMLGAGQSLHAQCPPPCPRGAIAENEACGDEINKGCEAPGPEGSNCCIPNGGYDCDDIGCFNAVCVAEVWCCELVWDQLCADLASELCPALCDGKIVQAWTVLALGDTLCGTTWADGFDSDADWFAIELDAITEVSISLDAGISLQFAIADLDGAAPCDVDAELEPSITVPACSSGSLTACLEPGIHYIRVRPTALTGVPCGSPQATYVLHVEATGRSCVLPDPINDTCAAALPIGEGSTSVDTHDAATEMWVGDAPCGTIPFLRDVWYSYTASRDGVLRIATCGTASFPAMIGVYQLDRGQTCESALLLACDHEGALCRFGDPQLDVDVIQGERYLVRVGSRSETDGTIVLTLSYTACDGPYVVDEVGPPGRKSVATAISNTGEIVGMFDTFETYRWSERFGPQEILQSPSGNAHLFGVNDAGVAVGWINTGGYLKPASAAGLLLTPLPNTLGLCAFGIAYAINESGEIAGGLFAPSCPLSTPVSWTDGFISALPVPSATGAVSALNNTGSYCGDGSTSDSQGAGWTLIDGVFAWIPVATPSAKMIPTAINDENLVVGDVLVGSTSRTGFVWDGTSLTQLLPPAPYPHAALVDVNDAGTAVGEFRNSTNVDSNGGAFLLASGGTPRLLNMLLAAHSPLGINDVRAINDHGVIVGARTAGGFVSTAVRLVPQAPTGDTNCDGGVDGADLATVLGAWGECSMNDTCLADFTLDGRVDGADLAVVLGGWGPVRR